ncbi:MAG: GNAT family N-acetyltransferase [Acidobacteriota bacterium]|nr:GNAT family N-acetyltransferase [Acidobacteriota bacterium]MDH3523247.1 GNAT family N-acetyltransferase [Acidobacteriota bacterium]
MQPREVAAAPQPVTLRPAREGDAELLAFWRQEPSVGRYQPLGPVTLPRLRAELAGNNHRDLFRGRGEKFQWIVEHRGQPAGWITLVPTNWEHGLAEIGYALSTPFQRRGIAPLALRRLLAEVFGRTSLERIEARCAVANVGSRKVLEAIGFRREGLLRGYFVLRGRRVDNYLYAILRGDFVAGP